MRTSVLVRGGIAIAVALTVAATAVGCAKKEAVQNPKGPMWKERPSWALGLTFRRMLVAEQGTSAKTGIEKSIPSIDPWHGRVFVGTTDHGMYALRAGDGSTIWRFQTASSVNSEALYDRDLDLVFFGSDDDGMYAVRARDGGLVWRYTTGAEVQKRPVIVDRPGGKRIILFCNAADSVFAADAETGTPLWKRIRTPALGLEVAGHSGVAVDGDRVYVGLSTGHVAAYDVETGKDKWEDADLSAATGGSDEGENQTFDVDTTPIVHGDRVFAASVPNGVYALDATGGKILWRRPEAEGVSWLTYWQERAHADSITGAQIPARELLIAGSGTTGLWAIDPKTGDAVWRQKGPRGSFSYPVEIAGALLVTTSRLGLFLFSPRNGGVIDGIDPGTGFAGGPAAFGNRAFVLTNGGVLLGLEIAPPWDKPPGDAKDIRPIDRRPP